MKKVSYTDRVKNEVLHKSEGEKKQLRYNKMTNG
jgi:hypothetical protein